MKHAYPTEWPQFFTATIYRWQYLLAQEEHKAIIIESLQFLVREKRIALYAFVIMSNHIHLIWQPLPGFTMAVVRHSFMSYTGKGLRNAILSTANTTSENFKVNKHDRTYQVWQRDSLGVELFNPAVFLQKLEYIHYNPVKASLCKYPEDYYYSSAKFYITNKDEFGMLTHFYRP